MKSPFWLLAVSALVVAGGCQPSAKPAVKSDGPGASAEVVKDSEQLQSDGTVKPDQSSDSPSPQEDAAATAAKKMMTTPIATTEALTIKPSGSGNWKPSDEQPKLAQIGEKVDQALAKLPPAFVDARLTYKTEVGELIGKSEIKVQNDKMFRVTYNLPKNEAEQSIVIADGEKQAEKEKDQWRIVKKEGGEASSDELAAWSAEFPALMFSPLTDNRKTWGPLFRQWSKQGTKVEEKTETINGQKKVIYRVLHKSGDSQMEVILDGEMMLPMTVRTDYPRPGGGRNQMMWTGRWGFGGSHDAKDFRIPMAK
jgi:hypothetical protein